MKMHNGLWINLSDRNLGLQVAFLFYLILNANFLALPALREDGMARVANSETPFFQRVRSAKNNWVLIYYLQADFKFLFVR